MNQHSPLISVIVPSFNKKDFIEETLECLTRQPYENKEILVMDGGSTDGTLEILKKYDNQITWVSEKDKGQTDALNKGFRKASGDIIGWLNADDLYAADTLKVVGDYFAANPECMWVIGHVNIIDGEGKEIREWVTRYKSSRVSNYSFQAHLSENFVSQMGVFMRKDALNQVGEGNIDLHYAMDYDLWLRLGKKFEPGIIKQRLASFRMYEETKSMTGFRVQFREDFDVAKSHADGAWWPLFLHRLNNLKIVVIYELMALFRRLGPGSS